jgi:hypothetical protein
MNGLIDLIFAVLTPLSAIFQRTDYHDIAEAMLKVARSTMNRNQTY